MSVFALKYIGCGGTDYESAKSLTNWNIFLYTLTQTCHECTLFGFDKSVQKKKLQPIVLNCILDLYNIWLNFKIKKRKSLIRSNNPWKDAETSINIQVNCWFLEFIENLIQFTKSKYLITNNTDALTNSMGWSWGSISAIRITWSDLERDHLVNHSE